MKHVKLFENYNKTLNRDEMKSFLKKYLKMIENSEDFNGSDGGIWTSAENEDEMNGMPIFNYYAESSSYEFGVYNKFVTLLRDKGWFCEFYDPGTVMIWED